MKFYADLETRVSYHNMHLTTVKGKKITLVEPVSLKASTEHTIDGHFWVEDLMGNMIYDGGLEFSTEFSLKDDTEFIVLQPCPDAEIEKRITQSEVKRLQENWGKDTMGLGDLDPRTPYERFKAKAQHFWKNKDTMLSSGFECLQNSVCYWINRGEDTCRIRFGCAGIVRPSKDEVFWFFGHLDNTKMEEWLPKRNAKPTHEREMTISEVPNARKILEERKAKQEAKARQEMEEKENQARKAERELLAMCENEKKRKRHNITPNSSQKSNKKKKSRCKK